MKLRKNLPLCIAVLSVFAMLCLPAAATQPEASSPSYASSREIAVGEVVSMDDSNHGRLYWWPVAGFAVAGGGSLTLGLILRRKHSEKEDR